MPHPRGAFPGHNAHDAGYRRSVRYFSDSDGGNPKVEFRSPITPEFVKNVQEGVDLMKNGGRAEVQRRLIELLIYHGVDMRGPDADDGTSSDEEECVEEDHRQELPEIAEGRTQNASEGFSKRTPGKWLESF